MKERQETDPRRIETRAHSAEPSASGRGRAGRLRLCLFAVVMAPGLAMAVPACGDDDDDDGGGGGEGGGGDGGGTIALLLPETKTARYEAHDRPNFERKVEELCPDCEIIYSNADQDAAQQQQQTEAAITQGAEVLVLDPVDAAAAGPLVTRAKSQDIPVISYDRLITDADIDYYISFDNEKVGQLQGESLVQKLEEDGAQGDIVMINGAPTDNNATLFKKGAHSVIDDSPFNVAREYDTPDWSPDRAQQEMEQAITALGKDGFVGVYAANDGTAGGAIAAMKGNGIDPKTIPTTGQDAELAAIQRILVGEQYMTVYKAIKPEAEAAAELAVALLRGEDPSAQLVNGETDNGMKAVPSVLLDPIAVTKENIQDTIVKDEFWPVDEICAGRYASACEEAGIQ